MVQTAEKKSRGRRGLRLNAVRVMQLSFLLHLAIAFWNGYFGPSFGAEADAASFHKAALYQADTLVLEKFKIGHIYSFALAWFYHLTTPSLFLGSLLSCVAWYLSAGLMMKTFRLLSFDSALRLKGMIIYALLPSPLLFTSVTLREPYQLLFINLAVYCALKVALHRSQRHWAGVAAGVVGAGSLHGALFVFGPFLLMATLLLTALGKGRRVSMLKVLLVAPFALGVLYYGFTLFNTLKVYNLDNGVATAVETYQRGGLSIEDVRSEYKTLVQLGGPADLVLFLPVSLLQYLFEPMPWRVGSLMDVALFFENALRLYLLWQACLGIRFLPAVQRRQVVFLLVCYLVIETTWSLGTTNWGTAVRHHVPSMGLLVLLGLCFRLAPQAHRRRFRIRFGASRARGGEPRLTKTAPPPVPAGNPWIPEEV